MPFLDHFCPPASAPCWALRHCWVLLAIAWVSPPAAHAGGKQTPTAEAIAKAIAELAHDQFSVREKATVFLWKAGLPTERALQAAARDPDLKLEAGQRIQKILNRFKWGIFADTPKEVLELIDQYKAQTGEEKAKTLQKIVDRGPTAYPVAGRLI